MASSSASSSQTSLRDELQSLTRLSRSATFADLRSSGCLCMCDTCLNALDSNNEKRPCWADKRLVLGGMVVDALKAGVKSSRPEWRQTCITTFNEITSGSRPEDVSDILYLNQITPAQMLGHLDKRRTSVSSWIADERLLECARVLLICLWKCDRRTVERVCGGPIVDDDKATAAKEKQAGTVAKYKKALEDLTILLRELGRQITCLALRPSEEQCHDIVALNINYCSRLAETFAVRSGQFPWMDCFLANFGISCYFPFSDGPDLLEPVEFFYPSRVKVAGKEVLQINAPPLPNDPSFSICCICGEDLYEDGERRVFPTEYFWVQSPLAYPRQSFDGDLVCDPRCLLFTLDAKFPEVLVIRDDLYKDDKNGTLVQEMWKKISVEFQKLVEKDKFESNQFFGPRKEPSPLSVFLEKKFGKEEESVTKAVKAKAKAVPVQPSQQVSAKPTEGAAKSGASPPKEAKKKSAGPKVPEFDPDSDLLTKYKQMIAARVNNMMSKETHVSKVKMEWKAGWGKLGGGGTGLEEFTRADRQFSFNLCAKDILARKPTLAAEEKERLEKCFPEECSVVGSQPPSSVMAVIAVPEDYVRLRDYVNGIKFLASPASLEDSKAVRKHFKDEGGLLLFVKNFDLRSKSCVGGFLYCCKSSNSYVGILLADPFSFLTEELHDLQYFGRAFSNYAKNDFKSLTSAVAELTSDDGEKSAVAFETDCPARRDVLFLLSTVTYRLHWECAKENRLDVPISFHTVEIRLKLKEDTIVLKKAVVPGQTPKASLEAFAKSMGETMDSFTFTYADGTEVNADKELSTTKAKYSMERGYLFVYEAKPNAAAASRLSGVQLIGGSAEEKKATFTEHLRVCKLSVTRSTSTTTHKTFLAPTNMTFQTLAEKFLDGKSASVSAVECKGMKVPFKTDGEGEGSKDSSPVEKFGNPSAVTPAMIARKYGVDRADMTVTITIADDATSAASATASGTSKKPAKEESKPNPAQQHPQPKDAKPVAPKTKAVSKRTRKNFFVPMNDLASARETVHVAWTGRFKVCAYDDLDDVVVDRKVWLLLKKSENVPNVDGLIQETSFNWRGLLRGALVKDRKFLDAIHKSRVMERGALCLMACMAPEFGSRTDSEAEKALDRIKKSMSAGTEDTVAPCVIVPFVKNEDWSFMLMRYLVPYRTISVYIPLDDKLAGDLLHQLSFISGFLDLSGEQIIRYRRQKPVFLGTLSGVIGGEEGELPEPLFAVLRYDSGSPQKHSGLRTPFLKMTVSLPPDQILDDLGNSVVLLVEPDLMKSALGDWKTDEVVDFDLACGDGGPDCANANWRDLLEAVREVDLIFYAGLKAALNFGLQMVFSGSYDPREKAKELAPRLIAAKVWLDSDGELVGRACVPQLKRQEILAGMLTSRGSKMAEMSLSGPFNWEWVKKTLVKESGARKPTKAKSSSRGGGDATKVTQPNPKSDQELLDQLLRNKQETARTEGSKKPEKVEETKKKEEKKKLLSETITLGDFLSINESNMKSTMNYWSRVLKEIQAKMAAEEDEEELLRLQSCTHCRKEGFDMPVCSLCGVTNYCSEKCLRDGSAVHARECKDIVQSRNADLIHELMARQSKFEREVDQH